MRGLEYARHDFLRHCAVRHEPPHVSSFGDYAIHRLPLLGTKCVIAHLAIVRTLDNRCVLGQTG
jgi:hypothetical protein